LLNDGAGNFTETPIGSTLGDNFYIFQSSALADTDGDGDLDLLVVATQAGSYTLQSFIFENQGDATFTETSANLVVTNPESMKVADLDGDGDADVVADEDSGGIEVWINTGGGSFVAAPGTPLSGPYNGPYTHAQALIDIDGDGDLDIAYDGPDVSYNPGLRFFVNDGTGTFSDANTHVYFASPLERLGVGNIDNDADQDIIVAYDAYPNSEVVALINDGAGNFTAMSPTTILGTENTQEVFLDDLNGDTFDDVILTADAGNVGTTFIYQGDGTGAFSSSDDFSGSVLPGNLDADGDLDFLVFDKNIGVMDNAGSFVFNRSNNDILYITSSYDVDLADIDGDADLDIITAGDRSANVWLNDGSGMDFSVINEIGDNAEQQAFGDLDGDTDIDMIRVPDDGTNLGFEVWTNDGTTLSFNSSIGAGTFNADRAELVDLDGDLDLDIVLLSEVSYMPEIRTFRNDGGLSFIEVTNYVFITGQSPDKIAYGDIDGDLDIDVVLSNDQYGIKTMINDGVGGLSLGTDLVPVGLNFDIEDIDLADLDGDGDLDMVAANAFEPVAPTYIFTNDGLGTFTANGNDIITSTPAYWSSVGDLDGDGDMDVIIGEYLSAASVWVNDGLGNFSHDGNIPKLTDDYSEAVLGDLDGDGDLDVVMGGYYSANLVFLNGVISAGNNLEADSLALVDLYNSTDGANWVRRDNWLTGTLDTWNGVEVSADRVVNLYMDNNNLNGDFPQSFGDLTELNGMYFNGNPDLAGTIPNSIWGMTQLVEIIIHDAVNLTWEMTADIQDLRNLQNIRAFNTDIVGIIPPEIGSVTSLVEFNVDNEVGTTLSGTIPTEIGNLINLVNLQFSGASITGEIPTSIGGLTSLLTFFAERNQLSGAIPSQIETLTQLQYIYLSENQLEGPLPTNIGNLINLQGLGLSSNLITGGIPLSIGGMGQLISLDLSNNQLDGSIPVEIGSLANLEDLSLGTNLLSGAVTSEIGKLELNNIDLSNNQLTGDFPDEIWQIGSLLELGIGGNRELNVQLPANLASLTQLEVLSMWNTLALKSPFPTDVYSLINLRVLDFGGHGMTGTLDAGIGNLTSLEQLWLWNNELEGDFPAEIAATSLLNMSITNNSFTSFPDVSAMGMDQLELQWNYLGFGDVIPNLGISNYTYAPQKQKVQVNLEVDEGGEITLVNDYTTTNNEYNWVFNQGDTISTVVDHTITGATLDNLGGYYCNISNPALADLTIRTPFYNIAFSGPPKSWTVDNSPNSVADFKSFYAATYGTNDGDTILVAGSSIPYDVGFSVYYSPRVIYGPGYFLAENPETQATAETAQIDGGMGFRVGSEGSEVYGLDLLSVVLNNQGSSIDDTLRNVHITGNRIGELSIGDDNQNILIDKNYITKFVMQSTTAVGTSRSYQDFFINNNIIDTVTTFFTQATAARNDMVNVNFDRNTINVFLDSIQDATVSNNVINSYQATNNIVSGNLDYAAASLANGSTLFSVDNDFMSTTNVDAGAFSGSDPYVLSGIAPIPHIYGLTDIGRIRLDTQIKNETTDDITKLSYVLGESGAIITKGDVNSLEAGNPIDLLFRPRLGDVTPGATVDMMLWAEDSRGVKSVPQKLSFTAETTTVTGNVISSSGSPVDNGELLLFEINQEGAAFDTLTTVLDSQGQFTLSNIVIGDYLALANADEAAFPEDLPTYFENIDLWEEADTILLDNTNASFDITLIARPKDVVGQGVVTGVIEEEFDDETGGRLEGKRRVGGASVSARRINRGGRAEEDTYVLVAQVFSDENGEFNISELPEDEYRINIQYPGFPMDETSNIDFEIGGDGSEEFDLVALVVDGEISVTLVSVTGLLEELVSNISVYPNPAVDNFINIAFNDRDNLEDGLVLGLYNMVGSLLVETEINKNEINAQGVFQLQVSALQKGTYIMTIKSKNEVVGDAKIIIR
jgi:Leucine-rich repeat (LRR) protein